MLCQRGARRLSLRTSLETVAAFLPGAEDVPQDAAE